MDSARLFPRSSEQRGLDSERRVAEALACLAQRGQIDHYYPAIKGQELDCMGVDFLVFMTRIECIPVQVKSSHRGEADHIQQYGWNIPCIVAEPYLSISELADQIIEFLEGERNVIVPQPRALMVPLGKAATVR
jgi:hypothetical protein